MGEDKEFIEDQLNSHLFIPIAYTKSYMNQIIGMLHADRVDTIVNSPFVTNYHFKMKSKNHKELRNAGCIASRKVWFGLAPVLAKKNRVEAIGRIVDRGIRLLRKDGTLSIILSKYGLKDWR
jgi:ABC-type amino acid transport substrate-binding protein